MALKQEKNDMDLGQFEDENYSKREKRVRKPPKEYPGDIKGETFELSMDKAMDQLEKESMKKYGYRYIMPPMRASNYHSTDIYSSAEFNNQLSQEGTFENTQNATLDSKNILKQEMAQPVTSEQESSFSHPQQNDRIALNEYVVPSTDLKKEERINSPGMLNSTTFSSSPHVNVSNEDIPISKTGTGGGICFCGKQFSRLTYCRSHFITVHGESFREKDLLCLVCKQAFAYSQNLATHMRNDHNIKEKVTMVEGSNGLLAKTASGGGVCLVCTKQFSRLTYCKAHFKTHNLDIQDSYGRNTSDAELEKKYENTDFPLQEVPQYKAFSYEGENIPKAEREEMEQYPSGSQQDFMYRESYADNCAAESERNSGKSDFTPMKEYKALPDELKNTTNPQLDLKCSQQEHMMHSESYVEYPFVGSEDPSTMLKLERSKSEEQTNGTSINGIKREENYNKTFGSLQKKTSTNKPKCKKILVSPKISSKDTTKEKNLLNSELKITKMESGKALCEVCGTVLSRFDKAKTHYIKQHGETGTYKNFHCQVCNEGYVFEQNLKEHIKIVHKISGNLLPYSQGGGNLLKIETGGGVCLLCEKTYSRIDKAVTHYREKHEGNEDTNLTQCIQQINREKEILQTTT